MENSKPLARTWRLSSSIITIMPLKEVLSDTLTLRQGDL